MKKFYTFAIALVATVLFCGSAMAQTTKYVKVKAAPEDWSGKYLIVYEDDDNNQALVFNGALDDLDVQGNYFAAANGYQTINGEEVRVVDASDEVNAATFTISKSSTDGCYYIVSASGCGIGYNKFDTDEEGNPIEEANMSCKNGKKYDNTIAMQEGKTNVIITAKVGYELRFNTDSGKTRFRYYAPGKKKAIKLYREEIVDEGGNIVTGISNTEIETTSVHKILEGRQLIIEHNGERYTVSGTAVK